MCPMKTNVADTAIEWFEKLIIAILIILIMVGVAYATVLAVVAIYQELITGDIMAHGEGSKPIQEGLYRLYGAFLTILLGLELIATVKIYFHDNYLKLELIFIISILALSRHVIQIDYHHVESGTLYGLSALFATLIGGYIAIKKYLPDEKGKSEVS